MSYDKNFVLDVFIQYTVDLLLRGVLKFGCLLDVIQTWPLNRVAAQEEFCCILNVARSNVLSTNYKDYEILIATIRAQIDKCIRELTSTAGNLSRKEVTSETRHMDFKF